MRFDLENLVDVILFKCRKVEKFSGFQNSLIRKIPYCYDYIFYTSTLGCSIAVSNSFQSTKWRKKAYCQEEVCCGL